MAASCRFLDTDQSTVITSHTLANVATPGSSTNKKFYVQNIGTTVAEDVEVALVVVGTNDGITYGLIAPDAGGSPGTFGTTAILLGDIAALGTVPFWFRVTQPAGLTADDNPRRLNLTATYGTV